MIKKLSPIFKSGLQILDDAYDKLQYPQQINLGMDILMYGLRLKKMEWEKDEWRYFCDFLSASHPIRKVVHQDPITFRSFSKPRGYAGDAVLLDFLYREPSAQSTLEKTTDIGRAISQYQVSCPASEAVRWRRDYLAMAINEAASRVSNPEILSVACGHLREAQDSVAVQKHLVKRLVALDQDEKSLTTVANNKNGANIECVNSNIKKLITGKLQIGKFDFIYSAGLCDYLNDSAASLLTRALFGYLKPGGRLLIANFLPGIKECGYMEAFMDWELNYRSIDKFKHVVVPLTKYVQNIFTDDKRYVVYIELINN